MHEKGKPTSKHDELLNNTKRGDSSPQTLKILHQRDSNFDALEQKYSEDLRMHLRQMTYFIGEKVHWMFHHGTTGLRERENTPSILFT